MEGHGVTNYSLEHQPSYAYTDRTTEFDDALLQRNIVTQEQVLLSKGMSLSDVQRLLLNKSKATAADATKSQPDVEDSTVSLVNSQKNGNDCEDDEDDSDFMEDNDDAFLQEYRQKRMAELQESVAAAAQERKTFGEVVWIDRTEWIRHVNDESRLGVWVVVCLTSSDTERTGSVQAAVQQLAVDYNHTKFVCIPSHSAIPNWPESNLPSLFLYRDGTMQHELVRLPVDMTIEQLENVLMELTVLE